MKSICIGVIVTVFGIAHHLNAQTKVSPEQLARIDFFEESGVFSTINIGRTLDPYPNYPFIDSPFLYSWEYTQGNLSYDGKLYEQVYLNLNVHKEQLSLQNRDESGRKILVELDPLLVDYFELKGEKFIYYDASQGLWGIPTGFYAVLHQGPMTLLCRTFKEYKESIVDYKIVRSFFTTQSYFLVSNETVFRLTGEKSLLKVMGPYQKEVRKLIKAEHLKFRRPQDNPGKAYAACISYFETLRR